MNAVAPAYRIDRRRRRPSVPAQSPHVGLLVAHASDSLGAAFRPLAANSWALEVPTRSQRSQVVFIEHDRVQDRIVLRSIVGPYRSNLGSSELIRHNGHLELGNVCVEDLVRDGMQRSYLTVRHVQRRTPRVEDLRAAISLVGWAADEMERSLFARDVE